MHALAPAKINLYLHVTGRRDDGYHLLDSMVAFADIGDEISLKDNPSDIRLFIDGQYADALRLDDDNLVLKAARLLRESSNITQGADIYLTKNLPISSGIGGGSSDAATTLKLLNRYWNTELDLDKLTKLALPLGADMPICLKQQSSIMRGIGEIITPIEVKETLHAVLVNPNIAVSSAKIYSMGVKTLSGNVEINTENCLNLLPSLHNDLQDNAIEIAPVIKTVLEILNQSDNLFYARMSGSGATCFAVYKDEESAQHACKKIAQSYPQWWVRKTLLR